MLVWLSVSSVVFAIGVLWLMLMQWFLSASPMVVLVSVVLVIVGMMLSRGDSSWNRVVLFGL